MNSMLLADLWTNIIDLFAKWIVNYGWAIVVFTIVLKLVLCPLDIMQRVSSQKQARVSAYMQPELAAIKKKYGNDKARVNAETQKLYKKYNTGMGGICFTMAISLIVTMVVFFTLFGSIRSYGNTKLYESYNQLDTAYVAAEEEYQQKIDDGTISVEVYATPQDYAISQVKDKYAELKDRNSWFWVKNVWKGDTKTSQFVSFSSYASHMNLTDNKDVDNDDYDLAKARYQVITNNIVGDSKDNNGYYVLIVMCALVNFFVQFLSAKLLAPKGTKLTMMNIIMMIVLPLSMLLFAWTSNVVFTLYILTNSIMSALISTIITLIINKINSKKSVEELIKPKVDVVEYSRNYNKK